MPKMEAKARRGRVSWGPLFLESKWQEVTEAQAQVLASHDNVEVREKGKGRGKAQDTEEPVAEAPPEPSPGPQATTEEGG